MPVYRRKTAEKYWGLEKPVRRAVSATEQPSSSSRRARWIRATVICPADGDAVPFPEYPGEVSRTDKENPG